MTSFTIDGPPIPKGRPRFTRSGHVYTPKRTSDYEKAVAWAYKAAGGKRLEGAVMVTMIFRVKRDADIDNLAKAVLDGLNGVAWEDDRQVTDLRVYKAKDANPSAIIRVEKSSEAWEAAVQFLRESNRTTTRRPNTMNAKRLSMLAIAMCLVSLAFGCSHGSGSGQEVVPAGLAVDGLSSCHGCPQMVDCHPYDHPTGQAITVAPEWRERLDLCCPFRLCEVDGACRYSCPADLTDPRCR